MKETLYNLAGWAAGWAFVLLMLALPVLFGWLGLLADAVIVIWMLAVT